MDPRKFDEMIKKLSQSLSRRSIVGGTVGASLLTAAGLSEDALAAKNKKNRDGKKDDKDKGKKDGKDKDKKGGGKDNNKGGGAKQNKKNRGGGGGNDKKDNDKKGGGGAGAEACIPTGKRCPSKKPRGRKGKNKKPKKLSCDRCCQDEVVTITNAKGKQVTKCACKPVDSVCTPDKSHQCCSGVCGDGRCQFVPCTSIGGTCTDDFDCCSGFCDSGACAPLS